jgi:hypothetical protein
MRTIKASEIGSFLYCRRAWWYQRQGIEPENKAVLAAGTDYHTASGRKVAGAELMKWIAWIALLIAFVLLGVGFTISIFN